MLIDMICPTCASELTFLPEQGGSEIACPRCGHALLVPSSELEPAAQALAPNVRSGPTPSVTDSLELGPRWRSVARALRWVRLAYGVWLVLIPFLMFAIFLPALQEPGGRQNGGDVPGLLAVVGLCRVICFFLLSMYGIALFVGRASCLRVPAGTRCRSFVGLSVIATPFAPVFIVIGSILLTQGLAGPRSSGDPLLLQGFALWSIGLAASLVADVSFLTFLNRLGKFLEVADMGSRLRRVAVTLILSALFTVAGVMASIESLPSRQSYEPIPLYLILGVVLNCLVSFVLGFEYRGALAAGIAAITAARPPR